MLSRRNTIHPSHPAALHHTTFTSKSSRTNPFLSSSFDDLRSPSYTFVRYDNERLSSDYAPSNSAIKLTNPFTSDNPVYPADTWTDTLPEASRKNAGAKISDDSSEPGSQHIQKTKSHHRQESQEHETRRLSLDLFKAPFGWHRRRRATCASSDLRRMVKYEQGSKFDKRASIGNVKRDWDEYSQHPPRVSNELKRNVILKSSRYHPEEQEPVDQRSDVNEDPQVNDEPIERTTGQRPPSFNPFLVPESDSESIPEALPEPNHPRDSRPDILWRTCVSGRGSQRQSWTADDSRDPAVTDPVRRRHSILSDWSIEDCPRLMAFQKQQQLEQEKREQEEFTYRQTLSESRMSMTRSTTDTVLTQYQDHDDIHQHRRRASTLSRSHNVPPPASSSASRPRRNSVVIGRNISREHPPPPRSLRTGAWSRPEVETQPPTDEQNMYQKDAGLIHVDERKVYHESWTLSSVHPFDKPRRPGSLTRRESQSYAQDFVNDTEHWVPRPWTAASTCSSPSSPLHQRIFPHERDDHDSEPFSSEEEEEPAPIPVPVSDSSPRDVHDPTYLDTKRIQLRPYGQEDGIEQDKNGDFVREDVRDDCDNTTARHDYVYDTEVLWDQSNAFHDSDHDVRHYYNSVDWQETMEYPESQEAPAQSTFNRSRDRITRRATLAKAKFYKLLKHPTQHPQHYHDTDESYLDLYPDSCPDENDDPSRSESSVYSVTSSLRARMRLNSKTKTVLRQVKRRLSSAAKAVMSEANKAASNVSQAISEANKATSNKTSVSRRNTLSRKKSSTRRSSTTTQRFAGSKLENEAIDLQNDHLESKERYLER
ncbi:hypothetical protein B0O80DRAFT_497462 [Mortierella sp. GBAus27b]|nr:hypothetical protein BGX31_010473 [Mortierella sp. GBA43]KAI8355936.1 hypothetical protein B0O80DRAFT_497462 [Mortierella sp. GBAus27b]